MSIISLPFLALLAGLGALFYDPKKPNNKWITIGLAVVIFATFLLSVQENYKVGGKEITQKKEIEWSKNQISDLSLALKNFRKGSEINFDTTIKYIDKLSNDLTKNGWNKENIDQILESFRASQEKNKLLSKIVSTNKIKTTLQYFPKKVDKEIVSTHLKNLGFKVILGTSQNDNNNTNAIWYSKNKVPISEVKLVAFTLLQAGVKIQTIKPFANDSTNYNKHKIQVGTDKDFLSQKPITAIEIQSASSFTR